MSYALRPYDAGASVRSILADVHARAGKLSRSKNLPGLATTPDDEPRLVEHMIQASRVLAVETNAMNVTIALDVSADTSRIALPPAMAGAKVARATWTPEASGETTALLVTMDRYDPAAASASGVPTVLWVGPGQLALSPGAAEAGTLALGATLRTGFALDGTATPEAALGIGGAGTEDGDALQVLFPRELARALAFLVLREHCDELGELELAAHFEERATQDMKTMRVDDRQTGFARATPRPFG